MRVVDDSVAQARLRNRAGERWLPDALGQPHAGWPLAEIGLDRFAQQLHLPDFVIVTEHDQDRLVVSAAQDFKLAALDQHPRPRIEIGTLL